jgi:hypothetical protein
MHRLEPPACVPIDSQPIGRDHITIQAECVANFIYSYGRTLHLLKRPVRGDPDRSHDLAEHAHVALVAEYRSGQRGRDIDPNLGIERFGLALRHDLDRNPPVVEVLTAAGGMTTAERPATEPDRSFGLLIAAMDLRQHLWRDCISSDVVTGEDVGVWPLIGDGPAARLVIEENIDAVVRIFANAAEQMIGYVGRKLIVRITVMLAAGRNFGRAG